MKKIDLHIHTVPSVRDSHFSFSIEKLKSYVSTNKIDALAITNHDLFDREQFVEISSAVDAIVFPGIEISLGTGHILVISEPENLDEFEAKTKLVSQNISTKDDTITTEELKNIFVDLGSYLVIPHYDKKPAVRGKEFNDISQCINAGEVDSAKKFIRNIKDVTKLTPVIFSDTRIRAEMTAFPTRQTYIDCGDVTIRALKDGFKDKNKVALSEDEGNTLFPIFDDGQRISTGLNILLGERSSGKTYTLNRISDLHRRVKYIKQFSLVQQDSAEYEKEFNKEVSRKRSIFSEDYLKSFKVVLDDVLNVDLRINHNQVNEYIGSLKRSAEDFARKDAFSKAALFDESEYTVNKDQVLIDLIGSVRQLIENVHYRSVIEKHLNTDSLKALACELINTLWLKEAERKKKTFVNGIVKEVKERLRLRTSATQIKDVDLYHVKMDQLKVDKFKDITKLLQSSQEISRENVQGFSVVTTKRKYTGPGEIKSASGLKVAFSDSYRRYEDPYEYLSSLKLNESLTPSEFYKYFVKIDYKALNKDGYEVSGGERSEFRLLQEINDAQNHDILLIDEPESSFDNLFLKSEVNQIIKEISMTMPVVVVTHNNTVGASIGADYIIYACKEFDDAGVIYRLYSGHPTDSSLTSLDGRMVKNFDITLNSLEAGNQPYDERRQRYDVIKN